MKIKDILELSPSTLAEQQHKALTKAVLEKLDRVRTLIQNEDYDILAQCLAYSPAGDGMGCDNEYIDFSDIYGDDISDVVGKLIELNKLKGNNQ